MSKIFIETNENDYMMYFKEAANALSPLVKNWSLDWNEEKIRESFISLTQSFYFVLRGEEIHPEQVKKMTNDLEIYFDKDAEYHYYSVIGNGSSVRINWGEDVN